MKVSSKIYFFRQNAIGIKSAHNIGKYIYTICVVVEKFHRKIVTFLANNENDIEFKY